MLSILTPAFNEEANLDALYTRISDTMTKVGGAWEWLIIDDHSRDDTFAVIRRLAEVDSRVRGIRLARNSGSHIAIACGLHHVRGDAVVMLASDLQDPPETIAAMLRAREEGAEIVWAVRRERPGAGFHLGFATLYYWIMRHVVGMKEMPARGSDCFLMDRVAIDAFRQYPERNISVLAMITSLGFRQAYVDYEKQPRQAGRSGWTLARKIALVLDSVTGFSDAPLRWCGYAGLTLVVLGIIIGFAGFTLLPSVGAGLLLLVAAVVGVGGLQLIGLAIVGQYVWRALDEARRRPAYLIEAVAGDAATGDVASTQPHVEPAAAGRGVRFS